MAVKVVPAATSPDAIHDSRAEGRPVTASSPPGPDGPPTVAGAGLTRWLASRTVAVSPGPTVKEVGAGAAW